MAFVAGTAAMPRVSQRQTVRSTAAVRPAAMAAPVTSSRRASFFGASVAQASPAPKAQSPVLSMKLRVAVVGGGPAGSCCAEELAKAGIDVHLFERKMDNAKPCGGAIPLCMVDEFSLPEEIIDRKVRKMAMISPSNKVSQIGATLKPHEYIGMTRREILDGYLRDRAISLGAKPINGLVTDIKIPSDVNSSEPYVISYSDYAESTKGGAQGKTLEVDYIIGADGANSRVAKAIDAGDYQYAIAFQERIKLPAAQMEYYEELAEMYVGDDVSPDFYAWVFPKYDHVGVGTGTVIDRPSIKKYQQAIRTRAADKLAGGKIIKIEAHPIPEHPRPRRCVGRVSLVGDAAGYVTKASGEGIYFAAKSGRMAGEALVALSNKGERTPTEADIKNSYIKDFDRKYWATYKALDILQSVFYKNDKTKESFVELCDDEYVQRVTFDSYLYKTVTTVNPVEDVKLLFRTVGSLVKQTVKSNAANTA